MSSNTYTETQNPTRSKFVLDLELDNEPSLGELPPLGQLLTAYRLLADLRSADREVGQTAPDVAYRPVRHFAVQGEQGAVVTPTWLRLSAHETMARVDEDDFRDELRVANYPNNELVWDISVAADAARNKAKAKWLKIGKVIFSASVTSLACDTQLHFAHPTLTPP